MISEIKLLEDISLNAWPSYQMQLYDGWILRYSDFYTHRTNCIEQIGTSTIPWEEKLRYCEEIYRYWNTPTIYKITPMLPPLFDSFLEEHNYTIERLTFVMAQKLKAFFPIPCSVKITLEYQITPKWLEGLFRLKNTTKEKHLDIVPSMYAAIPKDIIAASISIDNKIVATGLGILDRNYIGLYAIHVDDKYCNQQWGRGICSTILNEGMKRGASYGYLQVIDGNDNAKHLYESLGFIEQYTYWFRTKQYTL